MSRLATLPWATWRRQALALARQELSRRLFSRRSLPVYILLAAPVGFAALRALLLPLVMRADVAETTRQFGMMFHVFLLRIVVYLGCAGLFINLFRGEILDRSLHYSLLAPLRREVLVVGKYLGGLVTSIVALTVMTAVTYLLFYLPHGVAGWAQVASATGLGSLARYLLAVALGCLGYGALFILAGLLFKNPMVPAMVFLGWELVVPFLPPVLKMLSITHHLTSFYPVPIASGPFAMLAEPTPPLLAVLGLLIVSAVLLTLAAWRARYLEISYATD